MTYRIIALDLDGTLLTGQKTILPASLAALKQAQAKGLKIIIVTGRHHVAIHPFYQILAPGTPAICCNGTYLYDYQAKKVLASDPLRPEQATTLLDLLDEYQVPGLMYVDNAMVYQTPTGHVVRMESWAKTLPPAQRPVLQQVHSLREAAQQADAIWKFALTDENKSKLKELTDSVTQQLALECEWSWFDQVDMAQQGNSKGKRLTQWVTSQGLSMESVIAFGDNYNDVSMLEAAGLGIAMGNADDEVKSHADQVTGTNEESGIADALHRYVL